MKHSTPAGSLPQVRALLGNNRTERTRNETRRRREADGGVCPLRTRRCRYVPTSLCTYAVDVRRNSDRTAPWRLSRDAAPGCALVTFYVFVKPYDNTQVDPFGLLLSEIATEAMIALVLSTVWEQREHPAKTGRRIMLRPCCTDSLHSTIVNSDPPNLYGPHNRAVTSFCGRPLFHPSFFPSPPPMP